MKNEQIFKMNYLYEEEKVFLDLIYDQSTHVYRVRPISMDHQRKQFTKFNERSGGSW